MTKKEKKLIIISILVSIFLIIGTLAYKAGISTEVENTAPEPEQEVEEDVNEPLEVGEPGSTHAHIAFLFLIDDNLLNLNQDRYKELSRFAHFHDEDGVIIHKHATGVSLPYFLETLGFRITENCVVLDDGDEYCNEDGKQLTMVVNGDIIEDMFNYELQHGDRILLYYSDDDSTSIRVKAQTTVPEVPPSLMEDSYNTP